MLPWFLYITLGFGPAALIAVLALRALRKGTGEAWADHRDASTLLGWLMPGLAVLAVLGLPVGDSISPTDQALLCVFSLALFSAVGVIFHSAYYRRILIQRPSLAREVLGAIAWWLRGLGPAVTVGVALVVPALSDSGYALSASVWTFVRVTVALWIGRMLFSLGSRSDGWIPGKSRILAPGELASRAGGIARRLGASTIDLRVFTDVPFKWAGGCAFSPTQIAVTEDLVRNLRKEEVDAVLVHEVAHAQERWRWWLYLPAALLGWLLLIWSALALERLIAGLPQPLFFLQYLLWLSLFFVPKFALVRYSRHGEDAANARITTIADPRDAISCMHKLAIIDDWPVDRPWWSRLISTHPTPREEAERAAREHGLKHEDLARIEAEARRELDEHAGEYYHLAFHEESRAPVAPRPERRGYDRALKITASAVVVLLFTGLVGADSVGAGMPLSIAIVVATAVIAAAATIPLIYRRRVRQFTVFREEMRDALCSRYPRVREAGMLLAEVVMMPDYDSQTWQAGMVGVDGAEFVILGELDEQRIPLGSITRLSRCESSGSQSDFLGNGCPVVVWYHSDGASQWVLLRNLGKPERGLPPTSRHLEHHLRDLLRAAGAELPQEDLSNRPGIRQYLLRGAAAVLVLAAIAVLLRAALSPIIGWSDDIFPLILALTLAGRSLWMWVTDCDRAPR